MVGGTAKFEIEVIWDGNICPYCGQERQSGAKMCEMCQKHMTTVVLALCKDLLYHSGQIKTLTPEKGKRDSGKEAVKELEVYQILENFPYAFAKRTIRYRKALETEGVWFSHLVAFRFICHIRADRNLSPPMIIGDPMYQMVRQQVYNFLENENPDQETCEAFNNVYNIPDAEDDARAVVLDMVDELERLKRLKIARPKSICQKCGKEMDNGKSLCPDCERDEALNNRLAISSGIPQPLLNKDSGTPDSGPGKMRGMHWKEE